MYPSIAQIIKDIQIKPNHQLYSYNKSQKINERQITNHKIPSKKLNEIILNHQIYSGITIDIQE